MQYPGHADLSSHSSTSCTVTEWYVLEMQARNPGTAPVPLGSAALQQSQTSYALDFGQAGDDPLDRTARSADRMTATASTQDLAEGTARSASQRIPGGWECVPFGLQGLACAHERRRSVTLQAES